MSNIPKKIHYCWFGGNEKPEIVIKCMASWEKYMTDYQICEWNETNYDCHKVPYIHEAYCAKKWAFVSDYARFDILNEFGGIYFDTDVELLKRIPDEILDKTAFTGIESSGSVNPGLVFASIPNTFFLKDILKRYNNSCFMIEGKPNYKTVNMFTNEILLPKGLMKENRYQEIYEISIYPSECFCGYDQDVHEYDIRPETISVHHYAGTWLEHSKKSDFLKKLKKIIGVRNYRRMLNFKRFISKIGN
ncbi:MAG: capsular polysaccharide synthesis protein [Erysipelotrichaceae bacterium]